MSTKGWPTFLAATHKQLVAVNAGVVETIHKDEGEYYGITWDNHNVYLAHQKNFKSPDAPVISVLDSSLRVTHQLAGSCVDVHQILCHKDSLYVTNTSSNSIDVHTSGKVKNFNWTSHSDPLILSPCPQVPGRVRKPLPSRHGWQTMISAIIKELTKYTT